MDVGKSFTYMFEDPNWITKIAIGGAILLVGAIFFWVLLLPLLAAVALILGYSLAVTRNVAEGNPSPLPEWNNFGDLFVKGLTALVGIIIWTIPVWILVCCVWAVALASGAVANGSDAAQASSGILGLMTACLSCLLALVGFVIGVTLYAPLTRFALSGQLSTFWDFSGNLNFIRENLGNYIIAVLLAIVANIIAHVFDVCIVGVFFAFWANLVGAHLFGQVARGASAGQMMPPSSPYTPPMAPTMGSES